MSAVDDYRLIEGMGKRQGFRRLPPDAEQTEQERSWNARLDALHLQHMKEMFPITPHYSPPPPDRFHDGAIRDAEAMHIADFLDREGQPDLAQRVRLLEYRNVTRVTLEEDR